MKSMNAPVRWAVTNAGGEILASWANEQTANEVKDQFSQDSDSEFKVEPLYRHPDQASVVNAYDFIDWVASLEESEERSNVTLSQIIERAKTARGG